MGFNLADYQPVEDRLREFWERHPAGKIVTELVAHADGDYIVKALVYRGDELREDRPAATGYAHDAAAQLPANMKASALEVCETSAIGRALANLGFAPKGQRPSREEMSKASGPVEAHIGKGARTTAATARTTGPGSSAPTPQGESERIAGGSEPTGEDGTGSPAPSSCIHPDADRHQLASGAVRCLACGDTIEEAS